MRLVIERTEGLRNDLVLRIPRDEVADALLSVANRDLLRGLAGIPRHRDATRDEQERFAAAKVPIEEHLRRLGITGSDGRTRRRAVAISNRNLGANAGNLAWQRGETPRLFRIKEDPADYGVYACLTWWREGRLSIEDLRFDDASGRVIANGRDVSDDIEWANYGQPVLRGGRVARIDEILQQFYDLRHVLAFDPRREEGERIRQAVYSGYPRAFRENALRAWRELGAPRARYVHNAIGLSRDAVIVVQREGTVEEIGAALAAEGADDGVILDNGGSIACWVWWANQYAGGLISPTVDYRPPGTSAIAFVLKGPVNIELPGGSVSYGVA